MRTRHPQMALLAVLALAASASLPASGQSGFISIDDDPVLGDPDAPVTIIEFGDYQCPYCRVFWKETLPRLRQEYVATGKVRIVFRDYPQDVHPEAMAAAMAAECADDQGLYWEFHDKVFREQDRRGSDVVRFRTAELKRWGAEIRLDAAVFNACIDAQTHEDEVAKDHADGAAAGITGTPIFFVNGRVLAGAHPFASFQQVIEEELRK